MLATTLRAISDRSRTTGEPALEVLDPDMGVLQHMLVFEF
jgi:hypothetical protein